VVAQLMVKPSVTVLPNRITLPQGVLAAALGSAVTIRNTGTNLLVLSGAGVNVPGAKVAVQEIQTNRLFRVTVQFPAGFELKPEDQVEVSVKSNHPRYPLIRVPVVQSKRPGSPASAARAASPIGTVPAGESSAVVGK
jgi:hypothetical protein